MNVLAERAGASIRRAPYVWLALTLLLFVMLASALTPMVDAQRHPRAWIAWTASALIAYSVWSWWFMFRSRRMLQRLRDRMPEDRVAAGRWSWACAPFLCGFGGVAAGGDQWVAGIGFVVSAFLLVLAARDTARAS